MALRVKTLTRMRFHLVQDLSHIFDCSPPTSADCCSKQIGGQVKCVYLRLHLPQQEMNLLLCSRYNHLSDIYRLSNK